MTATTLTFTRRAGLTVLAGAALGIALASPALAQDDFPNRPISFISAYPAGSGADVFVRYFANEISELTGNTIIVENKPGAAGNIASEYVAHAAPDGYTVYVHGGSATTLNYHLWKNPPVDPVKDFRGVAGVNKLAFYITVGADSPYKTIEELNAYLKEAGDAATYATSNTSGRVLGAQYVQELGADPVEVRYGSTAEMLPDLVSLAVDFSVTDPANALAGQSDGRLRILATGAGERLDVAPDVSTLKETGLDIDQLTWWAAWVPAGTPDAVVDKLNQMFTQVSKEPKTKPFLANAGVDVWIASPEQVDEALVKLMAESKKLVDIAKIPQN